MDDNELGVGRVQQDQDPYFLKWTKTCLKLIECKKIQTLTKLLVLENRVL